MSSTTRRRTKPLTSSSINTRVSRNTRRADRGNQPRFARRFSGSLSGAEALLDTFERTNRRLDLIRRGDRILIAVSGGSDSGALLALLSLIRRKYSLELAAAHLNHGLSRSAGRLERAASELAKRFNVPFRSGKTAVKRLAAASGRSLEDEARQARYSFLVREARSTGCTKIAVAHTMDDQAETVLLRLLRGSGLRGLGGIPPARKESGFEIIRPLLDMRKRDLLSFVRKHKLPHAVDPTNADESISRNRVRRRLVPFLARNFNPCAAAVLASLADVCRRAQNCIDVESERLFRRALEGRPSRGKVSLSTEALTGAHEAVAAEALILAYVAAKGDAKGLTNAHIRALEALASGSPQVGREASLPGVTVSAVDGRLTFRRTR